MSSKQKSPKIERIVPSKATQRVEPTEAVQSVDAVRPTSSVQGVSRVGGVRGTQHPSAQHLTRAERDKLLGMIQEEADKLFAGGMLPKTQREVVKRAVTMAVDVGIIVEDEQGDTQEIENLKAKDEAKRPESGQK